MCWIMIMLHDPSVSVRVWYRYKYATAGRSAVKNVCHAHIVPDRLKLKAIGNNHVWDVGNDVD